MFEKVNYIRFLSEELSVRGDVANFVCTFVDRGDNYEHFYIMKRGLKYVFYRMRYDECVRIIKSARDYMSFERAKIEMNNSTYEATVYFSGGYTVTFTNIGKGV